jgi:phosphohistidine phosphatase
LSFLRVNLIFVRHALAQDRKAFAKKGLPDSRRPLVRQGEKDMGKIARVLKSLTGPVDLILTSPYLRTQQTAKIIAKRYPHTKYVVDKAFAADSDAKTAIASIKKYSKLNKVVIVGHEPNLSQLLSLYLTTKSPASFYMSKGGFAIIQFSHRVAPRRGQLKCFLSAKNALKIAREMSRKT